MAEVRDAANYLTVLRTAWNKKNYLAPNVNCDEVKKLRTSNHVAHIEGEVEKLIALVPVATQVLILVP